MNVTKEMIPDRLKLQPKALLKMFVELGREAQKELKRRKRNLKK